MAIQSIGRSKRIAAKEKKRHFKDQQILSGFTHMNDRIQKTFYYSKLPKCERPSLPLTNVAVRRFCEADLEENLSRLDVDYAARVAHSSCLSPYALMVAMVYLERLGNKCDHMTSSELFLISTMLASKFLFDDGEENQVFNDEWACSAGIHLEHLNKLERQFLAALDWELFVDERAFEEMVERVEREIAVVQGWKRGWWTYSDLSVLTKDISPDHCWLIVKVMMVSMAGYMAGLMTMLGSVMTVFHPPPSPQPDHPVFMTTPTHDLPPLVPTQFIIELVTIATSTVVSGLIVAFQSALVVSSHSGLTRSSFTVNVASLSCLGTMPFSDRTTNKSSTVEMNEAVLEGELLWRSGEDETPEMLRMINDSAALSWNGMSLMKLWAAAPSLLLCHLDWTKYRNHTRLCYPSIAAG